MWEGRNRDRRVHKCNFLVSLVAYNVLSPTLRAQLPLSNFIIMLPHRASPCPSCLPSFVPTKLENLQPLPLPEYGFTIVPSLLRDFTETFSDAV